MPLPYHHKRYHNNQPLVWASFWSRGELLPRKTSSPSSTCKMPAALKCWHMVRSALAHHTKPSSAQSGQCQALLPNPPEQWAPAPHLGLGILLGGNLSITNRNQQGHDTDHDPWARLFLAVSCWHALYQHTLPSSCGKDRLLFGSSWAVCQLALVLNPGLP